MDYRNHKIQCLRQILRRCSWHLRHIINYLVVTLPNIVPLLEIQKSHIGYWAFVGAGEVGRDDVVVEGSIVAVGYIAAQERNPELACWLLNNHKLIWCQVLIGWGSTAIVVATCMEKIGGMEELVGYHSVGTSYSTTRWMMSSLTTSSWASTNRTCYTCYGTPSGDY